MCEDRLGSGRAKVVADIGDRKIPLPVDSLSVDDRILWVDSFMDG
jgi:hypothetical protein